MNTYTYIYHIYIYMPIIYKYIYQYIPILGFFSTSNNTNLLLNILTKTLFSTFHIFVHIVFVLLFSFELPPEFNTCLINLSQ